MTYYPTGAKHNHAPQLSHIGPQTAKEGDTLQFAVSAVDPDGITPTLSAIGLPSHASFVDNGGGTGRFLFVPDTSQAGEYQVTFVASDGELADSDLTEITVTEASNHAPVLNIHGPRTVGIGATLVLMVGAYDGDHTTPVVTASGLPENAIFTRDTLTYYTFTFTPDSSQMGDHDILFVASDGSLSDSETVTISVSGTALLIPTAVGNYWLYDIYGTDSAGGMAAAYEEVLITRSIVDGNGNNVWWRLSDSLPPFGTRFMVRHDSVFSGSGLEFIRVTDGPLEYFVTSTPEFPGFDLLSGASRVVSRLESVIVTAGIFKNCYRYERKACGNSSAGTTCYDETYVIAPGVGIIEIGLQKSVTLPANSYETKMRWQLSRYRLEQQ